VLCSNIRMTRPEGLSIQAVNRQPRALQTPHSLWAMGWGISRSVVRFFHGVISLSPLAIVTHHSPPVFVRAHRGTCDLTLRLLGCRIKFICKSVMQHNKQWPNSAFHKSCVVGAVEAFRPRCVARS
jgi:hypothetical protein